MNKTMVELEEAVRNGWVLSMSTTGTRIRAVVINRGLKKHTIQFWEVSI